MVTSRIDSFEWEEMGKGPFFATYSLSLAFFESIALRALREVECREIWVVADAEGYRSLLLFGCSRWRLISCWQRELDVRRLREKPGSN
jgi:hypothetical protein